MYALLIAAMQIAAPGEIEPTFKAISPADETPSGRIVRLGSDFTVVLAEGTTQTTIKDLISLRRCNLPLTPQPKNDLDKQRRYELQLPPSPNGPHLITTTGDRVAGRFLGGDAQTLKFLPAFKMPKDEVAWKIPLSSAAALWLTAAPADIPFDPAQYEWLAGNRNRDVFRFRNGDTDKGTLEGIDADGQFNFRPEQGMTRTLRPSELAAVGFNPSLARTRKPKGTYSRVILTDSTRLALSSATIEDGVLKGETLFGLKVEIPTKELLSLDVMQGKATYLSDLKPKTVEQSGFLGVTWPWTPDRTVHGKPLRVATAAGESSFDKGLGMHPRTVLTYDLGGKYRRFEALVGFDPEAAIRGRASIRILVDGKEQDPGELSSLKAENAIAVRLNVQAVKELVLITDFATTGGVGADVNWCEARVIE
jgi:hypothetical protein